MKLEYPHDKFFQFIETGILFIITNSDMGPYYPTGVGNTDFLLSNYFQNTISLDNAWCSDWIIEEDPVFELKSIYEFRIMND